MRLNVPYIPDREYAIFLEGLGDRLYSVYFSLHSPLLNDGRLRMQAVDLDYLAEELGRLRGPRKYLLANGRFNLPDQYLQPDRLVLLGEQLSLLRQEGALDGIVFSDAYLLTALARQLPKLVAGLEAVPSINFILDSVEKIEALLQLVQHSGFLPPDKLPLDRELNRQPNKLKELTATLRSRFPTVKIELLANEGCLSHCPFRATHEALIAAANCGVSVDTQQINEELGCIRMFAQTPYRILASPFIRPEDMHHYEPVADIIKICGRSLGKKFLMRTIASYLSGVSPKNLLMLLDAANWMAGHWELVGTRLPADFLQLLSGCSRHCTSCRVCGELFAQAATELPLRLKDLRSHL